MNRSIQKNIKYFGTDTNSKGLVSIVIVTFNQIDYVKETVDSAIAQDYQNIQIIVSDDGSIDGTAEVIREYATKYPDKITAVLSDKNTGIAANLNRALNRCKGEYIAWLGGDDVMLPAKIGKQINLLNQRPDSVGCCHDAELFESPSGKILGNFSKLINGNEFMEGGVELWFDSGYMMLPSTVMIRSSAVPKHGFDERLKYLNDWLLDVEIFRKGKCTVINEVLVRYRRHSSNVSGDERARQIGNEEKMIALGIVDARYPELHSLVRKRKQAFFLADATIAFKNGDRSRTKYCLIAAAHQGAWLRSAAVLIALTLFGPYLSKQMALLRYERSTLFIYLSKYF